MELEPYVEEIQRHVALAAEAGGDEARALADRLMAPLDATVRLALQNALADAAAQITVELAPGSVELRVHGRELAFVVTPAPADDRAGDDDPAAGVPDSAREDDGATARINVRMPEHLKARIEQAAATQHLSVNAWLVRAASAAVDRANPSSSSERTTRGPNRYRGWAK